MADSPYIVELNEDNFMQVAIEGSDSTPVLIDFWAGWCQPCKTLMPILTKLAEEYRGKFILAKLDTEAHPGIAQQLGIRSLPTVKLISKRQQVDEFMGALPESEVRRFLETHVGPAPEGDDDAADDDAATLDPRLSEAMMLHEQGQSAEAVTLLKAAQAEDPSNKDILLALGQISVATGELDTAEACLKALPEDERKSAAAERLAGIVELAKESSGSEDITALRAAVDANADDHASRYSLAIAESLAGNVQGALDHLLHIVQRAPDFNDGAAREKMLAMFNVLGDDPLATQYRRKLFAALH